MTAREKFKLRQRVRMTTLALTAKLDGASGKRTGQVAGFSRDSAAMVLIVRKGNKTKQRYHIDFWERY